MTVHPLRPIRPDDLPDLLALNRAWVPHVGDVDLDGLARLVDWASWTATTDDRDLLAIVLPPGLPYASPNYRWFEARYGRHAYVDRIAVAPARRGRGLGRAVYDALAAEMTARGVPRLTCEVNTRPPNPASLAFHEAQGFRRTGIRADAKGAVAMLIRPLPSGTADASGSGRA